MMTGLLFTAAVVLASGQLPPPPTGPSLPEGKVDAPFSKLFVAPVPPGTPGTTPEQSAVGPNGEPIVPPFAVRRGPQKKVVCGMTLIIVGSQVDEKMPRHTPKEGTTFTMRRVPPKVCGDR